VAADRTLVAGVASALALLVGAQVFASEVRDQRERWPKTAEEPFAPSPSSAPYVALGYRELAADLFYIRVKLYYSRDDRTVHGFRQLIEATVALDPTYYKAYDFVGRGTQWLPGLTRDDTLWSARLVERGIRYFPDDWNLPYLAGQTYSLDLTEGTQEEVAAWNAHGLDLLDHAMRMPGAPRSLGDFVAHMRTKLGQLERAVRDLNELIATTDDQRTRARLIAQLAELQDRNAEALEGEMNFERDRLIERWKRVLPEAPIDMYFLLGDPPKPYIDLGDLAAGAPLLGAEDEETYEPLPGD